MRKNTSAYLDLLRVCAALGVVVAHVSSRRFSSRLPDLDFVGHASVAVFFVMSGFVIAHVAARRERSGRAFAIARASRIYSVLVPAIGLTLVLDALSARLDPGFYKGIVYATQAPAGEILRCLLFVNQSYGTDYSLLSDSPVWSLGYEVPYYALFGILCFARGWIAAALLLPLLLIEGPAVWLAFPVWLLGAATQRFVIGRPPHLARAALALALLALLAIAYRPACALQARLYGAETHLASILAFGHSENILMFAWAGFVTAASIVVVDQSAGLIAVPDGPLRIVRTIAGSTFSIYLFHMPILVFIAAATRYDRASLTAVVLVLAVTILVAGLLSLVTERRKRVWDRMFDAALGFAARRLPPSLALSARDG